jgi:hypothetical protein
MEKLCIHCNKPITNNNRSGAKYCSRECFLLEIAKNKITKKSNSHCAWCSTPMWRKQRDLQQSVLKHGKIILFCNRQCFYFARRLNGIKEIHPAHFGTSIKFDYRSLAFKNYEKRCVRCGYDHNQLALDVHHKDNNHSNNNVLNLEILCCNCHMIEHRSNRSK